jgi:predicted kinase
MNQIKSFIQLSEEKNKAVVLHYGRMNPPTKGHEENVNGVKDLAAKYNADHVIVASHSHDPKKNPLTPEQKQKHLHRAFPDANVEVATKEHPTIIQHAKKLAAKGYHHLIVAAGADRAKEYHDLLHKYNGKEYHFKKITVTSTGKRKEGVSGTDMRNHAKNNDYHSFKKNLPSHIQKNDKHSRELFHDTRSGMGLHESANRSMFKSLFLVGGPGSGKDVIIRESIAEKNAIEINANKAYDFIIDKQKLSEETKDYQLNAIRNRSALVINGASDDIEKISTIKEELEELGYTTMMVFVNTSNEVSENRNKQHSRVISEQIRLDKWNKSQDNLDKFYEMFNAFLEFDNSTDLQQSDILVKENKDLELSDISNEISYFFKTKVLNETAKDWLIVKGRLDINEDAKSLFKDNLKKKHMLKNNNAPITQVTRKAGKIDDVRDGDVASNSDYIFKTYEQSEPTLKINPQPKVKAFDTDKETKKSKRSPVNSTLRGKVINTPGVGDQYDTRTSGSVYPMSGLGDVTYRESFSKFRKKVKEAIDDPGATDMGTFGGMGNGVNKDPLITPADKFATSGPDTKKKKINKQTKVGFSIERKNTSGK